MVRDRVMVGVRARARVRVKEPSFLHTVPLDPFFFLGKGMNILVMKEYEEIMVP
jgi:hypothetical protein